MPPALQVERFTRVYGALMGMTLVPTVTVWVVMRSIDVRPDSSGMEAVHTLLVPAQQM